MSQEKKDRLAEVVKRMAELRAERKMHLDAYNATATETDTLRAERASLEAEVAVLKASEKAAKLAAKAAPATEAAAS